MKKIKVLDNFYMYQFEPFEQRILGQNIYVLYGDKECIVFDAGYEVHMKQMINELKDYKIKYVICTHFHPDHVYGLNELPKQEVIGSIEYKETLEFFDDLDNELLIPTILVEDEMTIKFDNHVLKLVLNQGHSKCGMLIDVDGTHLLIGDDYIALNDGRPVLPYVAGTLDMHISGLINILNRFKGYTFLPSHGKITTDIKDIEYRLRYLEFCKSQNKNLSEFYNDDDINYINENWHNVNINEIKKAN